MKEKTRNGLATAGMFCAVATGALLAGGPAAAQTASTPPSCSTATNPVYSNVNTSFEGGVSFACVADIGTGVPNLMVGAIIPGQSSLAAPGGYVLYLNKNGAVVHKVCWGPAADCPP